MKSPSFNFQGGSQQDQILTPDEVVPCLAHSSNTHGGHYQPKVAFAQNQRDEVRMMEVAGALASEPGMKQQTYVAQPLYNQGVIQGSEDASAQKTNTGTLLLRVREEIGAQAFAQWGLGILDSLRTQKILRPEVHGEKFRQAPFSRGWVVYCSLSREEKRAAGAMQSLREACGERCPPQGWGPLEQLAGELGAYLSELSQPGAQAERFMHDLWQADEGAGVLQQALSEIQKMGRSADGEGQPAQPAMQVRRLTPMCCEFLQGFPRNYTLVPHRGKPAADGPRYKALGNSMAVPCMAWLGKRIQLIEDLQK
jgi:hypothetical protein